VHGAVEAVRARSVLLNRGARVSRCLKRAPRAKAHHPEENRDARARSIATSRRAPAAGRPGSLWTSPASWNRPAEQQHVRGQWSLTASDAMNRKDSPVANLFVVRLLIIRFTYSRMRSSGDAPRRPYYAVYASRQSSLPTLPATKQAISGSILGSSMDRRDPPQVFACFIRSRSGIAIPFPSKQPHDRRRRDAKYQRLWHRAWMFSCPPPLRIVYSRSPVGGRFRLEGAASMLRKSLHARRIVPPSIDRHRSESRRCCSPPHLHLAPIGSPRQQHKFLGQGGFAGVRIDRSTAKPRFRYTS